jgi:regulator of sigma E protease
MHNEVPLFYSQPAVVDYVVANSPAAKAGIQPGDKIVSFDSDENPTWEKVGTRAALDVNSSVPVAVERSGQVVETTLTVQNPEGGEDIEGKGLGLLPRVQGSPLSVNSVEPTMPAGKAGLRAGDVIESVDGHRFTYVGSMLAYLQETAGKPVDLTIQRGAETVHMTIQPTLADDGTGHSGYRLGFIPHPLPYKVEQLSLPEAARRSAITNLQYSGYIVDVLHKLFTRKATVQNLSGPIGIARQTGEAISMPGWQPIIGLMAMISLNLGIFNLLPVPILDGGMIVLLIIEGILRRDLNQEFKERIYQVAFGVLILFAAFVMFNDVTKLPIFSKLKP